jgi:hypothetical protein
MPNLPQDGGKSELSIPTDPQPSRDDVLAADAENAANAAQAAGEATQKESRS